MARWLPWCLVLATGCGARTAATPPIDAGVETDADTAPTDGGTSRPDAFVPPPPPPPPPVMCRGRDDVGGFYGATPLGEIAFPYVVAGIEEPGSHSCPRFFIRAGEDPTFARSRLEIQVPYAAGDIGPGLREGFMEVYMGGEVWSEPVQVDVSRADGLFDPSVPREERRGRASVSLHDATTDLEGTVDDAEYCYDFALCI